MNRKGFSLVELLVVVSIIGILSVILVPNVQEHLRRAKIAQTQSLISRLSFAITAYENDFGKYPESYNPQKLFVALTEKARTPYEPDSDEYRYIERGDSLWVHPDRQEDTRREQIISSLRQVPSDARRAQMDENVFVDAWGNTLYYVSSDEYNPGGRSDFRTTRRANLDGACAYEIRDNRRYKPFKPSSFQIISFGPDGSTIVPSSNNGGIGSMIFTDGKDNDDDDYIDHEDRVREGNRLENDPEVLAEDDITNFM